MPDTEASGEAPPPGTADDPVEAAEFDPPIEPGSPTVENAVFVLLGVAVALAVVIRLVYLFG